MLKKISFEENKIKSVCKIIWKFFLKTLYITGLIRIFKLREKLKHSENKRLHLN